MGVIPVASDTTQRLISAFHLCLVEVVVEGETVNEWGGVMRAELSLVRRPPYIDNEVHPIAMPMVWITWVFLEVWDDLVLEAALAWVIQDQMTWWMVSAESQKSEHNSAEDWAAAHVATGPEA